MLFEFSNLLIHKQYFPDKDLFCNINNNKYAKIVLLDIFIKAKKIY